MTVTVWMLLVPVEGQDRRCFGGVTWGQTAPPVPGVVFTSQPAQGPKSEGFG